MHSSTTVEQRIDERARRFLANGPADGARTKLTEFVVFGLKQGWACIFGAALLAVLLAARLWYPDGAVLARNDFLTLAAVAIQVLMVAFKLETLRELRVIILFHLVGTAMELFKTGVGSWSYEAEGVLRIGAVPLFSGFMYAAVGSYMVRVYRLFDLRFANYPRRWITAITAAAIYANFFTHHYIWDLRWVLLAAVVIIYGRCVMQFRVFRKHHRMPLVIAFLLVALFIWIAENIATWSGAWLYPSQVNGWHPVSLDKLVSWFLLMIISVVLVAWVYKPLPPDSGVGREEPAERQGKLAY
ncbi:MAG: putative integral rane protein [Pseudarthrobacter sp.]|nr:putative integral rane protein [Pseudarthrobacter sp.]